MTIELKVTAEHIANGESFSIYRCPIALALRELFPESWLCSAHDRELRVVSVAEIRSWLPPMNALQFMASFDFGRAVKPITIMLDDGKKD